MGGAGPLEEVSAVYLVRGREYLVSVSVRPEHSLTVEVEDRATGDEWRAEFTRHSIEEMTHKTGNFKRFPVFTAMLRTVLTQPTQALSLDLMTYADLEQLRQSKAGVLQNSPQQARSTSGAVARANKRYLILSYTAAFDKIHYPLPLVHQGQADPQQLKEALRRTRSELHTLRDRGVSSALAEELEELRAENSRLLAENRRLTAAAAKTERPTEQALRKEISALKALVRNLEEDLAAERSRQQRVNQRKGQDSRRLLLELEEVRASERALKARVRNLTQELALFRQPHRRSRPPLAPGGASLAAATESSRARVRSRSAGSEGSRQSSSRGGSARVSRERSLSPAVRPRFDPTAWVREQQRRKQELNLRRTRHWSPSASSVRSAPPGPGGELPSPRDSGSRRRYASSSGSECGSSASRTRAPVRLADEEKRSQSRDKSQRQQQRGRRRRRYRGSSEDEDVYREQAAEISEIDERLNRLQDFLRRNLPSP